MGVTVSPRHVSEYSEESSCSIGYCSRESVARLPESCKIRIHSDELFWKQHLKERCPKIKKREDSGLVALNAEDSQPFVIKDRNGITTNLDLFASAFFMVTGMEEIMNPELRDEHGRFTFSLSKWAEHYVDKPLVNIYGEKLRQWIEEVYGLKIVPSRRFSAVLSHDIDSPFFYSRLRTEISEMLNSVNGKGKFSGLSDLGRYLGCLFGIERDPYDTFSYLQEQEEKRDISATFFIMLSKDNAWGLDRKKYSRTLKVIHQKGNEIALHPGYESYDDPELIRKERSDVEALAGTSIKGVRNHFVRFKMTDTFHLLSNLDLSYDATLGFPDREAFRCGICTPYKPFDIEGREQIAILEIPLAVMDGTLRNYRKQSPQQALCKIESLIEQVCSCAGVLVFNWHNSFLIETNGGWREVYEKSLDALVAHHAYFMTCKDMAREWRKRWS
jgi:hypothetical protein